MWNLIQCECENLILFDSNSQNKQSLLSPLIPLESQGIFSKKNKVWFHEVSRLSIYIKIIAFAIKFIRTDIHW